MEKKTVLVIDDEMDMRIYITTVLETSGYAPIATREGKEGIRKAKEIHPDLIILDVMMPGDGGAETYRQLKADPELNRIPIVMLSAVKESSFLHYLNMLNTQQPGAIEVPTAYLEKPFDPEELIAAAESALG